MESDAEQLVEPNAFTEFVASQQKARVVELELNCRKFALNEHWRQDIQEAVLRSPKSKDVGSDEIFAECQQFQSALEAELRACCGQHGIYPKAWSESVLCPLLKKEPANFPKNWRAVAMLSHGRKIIKKAMNKRVRRQYVFHEA